MSTAFEAQRSATEAVVSWCVAIHFPAFEGISAKDFYWATGPGIELDDGHTYEQRLVDVPKGRHQQGRGNDYAEFAVSNPDYASYQELLPYEDLIEKAEVTIRKAYAIGTDLWESEIMFFGYLKDFTLDDTSKDFKFTSISDMSRTNFFVGNRILTRERCGTEFNVSGLNAAQYHRCGWQTAQGGNPLFCSKLLDGVDGCGSHNNTPRFYAVPGLTTAIVSIVNPGDDDPGGFGYGNGGLCFDASAFVVMSDWSLKPIAKVNIGSNVLGFDLFDNDRLVPSNVLHTFQDVSDDIWIADFDKARFRVKKNHLFYLGNKQFIPVASLGIHEAYGWNTKRNAARSHLMAIERAHEGKVSTFNLHTVTNNYIVCDANARFFYGVHNLKLQYGIYS